MRSIFNSLGSNYSVGFVSASLWNIFFAKRSALQKLERLLQETYEGSDVLLFYKGRDAIEACCRVLLSTGSKVITQAFSCYAVEEGILRAGMHPVYTDIGEETTNLTVTSLAQALKNNPDAKAVLIQHSLGIPADSIAIRAWCDAHGLLLFEDVAQGIGGYDAQGSPLGSRADAVIFSFGKDKIVDAVSGGAVVFRTRTDEHVERLGEVRTMIGAASFFNMYLDMLYPDMTSLIRRTHHLGLGKILFVLAKQFGFLGSPIVSRTQKMTRMHPAFAGLVLLQFKSLNRQIEHRKKIAQQYFECLRGSGLSSLITQNELERASNLRFSVECVDSVQIEKITKALKKHRIFISDRWYRKAVDCGSFACKTAYVKGSCPTAEQLADRVLNLPTHQEINVKIAQRICRVLLENLK